MSRDLARIGNGAHGGATLLLDVLQINGKVNSIMVDGCRKLGLVFESVVAVVEVVNSSDIKLQVTGGCPSLNIDKTDGAQV